MSSPTSPILTLDYRPMPQWKSAFLLVVVTFSGCGKGGHIVPEDLVPTSGVIRINGELASGVGVTFTPTGDTKGQGAWGVSDSQGQFLLKNVGDSEGIQPGSYAVHFSQYVLKNGDPAPTDKAPHLSGARQGIPPEWSDRSKITPKNTVNIAKGAGKPLEFDIKVTK